MARTIPRSNAALNLESRSEGRTSNASFPVDFQDLCSRAMDQALGIEKVSLNTLVDLNENVLDFYKNSLCFTSALSELLHASAKAFTFCIDLQMTCLVLMLPPAKLASEALSHFAVPASMFARRPGNRAGVSEELGRNMDAAVGQGRAA